MFWIMALSSLRMALADTPVAADLKSCEVGKSARRKETGGEGAQEEVSDGARRGASGAGPPPCSRSTDIAALLCLCAGAQGERGRPHLRRTIAPLSPPLRPPPRPGNSARRRLLAAAASPALRLPSCACSIELLARRAHPTAGAAGPSERRSAQRGAPSSRARSCPCLRDASSPSGTSSSNAYPQTRCTDCWHSQRRARAAEAARTRGGEGRPTLGEEAGWTHHGGVAASALRGGAGSGGGKVDRSHRFCEKSREWVRRRREESEGERSCGRQVRSRRRRALVHLFSRTLRSFVLGEVALHSHPLKLRARASLLVRLRAALRVEPLEGVAHLARKVAHIVAARALLPRAVVDAAEKRREARRGRGRGAKGSVSSSHSLSRSGSSTRRPSPCACDASTHGEEEEGRTRWACPRSGWCSCS